MFISFMMGCIFIPARSFVGMVIKGPALSLDVASYFFCVARGPVGCRGSGSCPPSLFGIFSCAGASCCLTFLLGAALFFLCVRFRCILSCLF